jgi:predicted DNA-binding transcriptional regulator YafY
MKVGRLISIIMILLNKERISAQELADTFEVSIRTIYRDMDTINLAGIPIRSTSGVSGGFEIMPNYKIDKKVFSTADLSAILMGLSNLSNMMTGDDLANALAKIRSFIPTDKAKDIELKTNQIYIDLSPWMNNKDIQPSLELVKTALQSNKLFSFDYTDQHGNKTTRTVELYQIVLKGNHWYTQGYCYQRDDFRLFKLSRMSNLLMLEDTFKPRDYQKPQLDFTDIIKTIQTTIKIRIHKSIMDVILDYCAYEDFSSDGTDYYIVPFPFIENDYYYNILLSLGDKCECLEPMHVRAEMKRKIQNIAKIYDN